MSATPDIFLSYNREDHVTARRFAEAFEREGFKVWWDATLRSGEAYDQVTEKALKQAKAVVVLWSKRSVESRWVRAEATVADRNKTLIPAMIEPCERSIMFELTQTAELSHWQGAADDKAWVTFLSDVRRFVEKDPIPTQPVPVAEPAIPPPAAKPGERGDAPSLAVLPFTNRSGLPEDDVFAIGMVEDVIDALSQGVNVRVLASSATARFHTGAITDLPAIAQALGVRYLLEGNVRRVGAVLRVTSQLVEAASGAILWTQKFERPLTELAALQEELVVNMATHLDAQVFQIEMERALKKPADLTAWEAVTRSLSFYRRADSESLLRTVEEAQRAVAIAPDYGIAQAVLAHTAAVLYALSNPEDATEVRRIRGYADRALALDPNNAAILAHVAEGLIFLGQPEDGRRHAERAVQLSPSYTYAHFVWGIACCVLNRSDEALDHLDVVARPSSGSHIRYVALMWQGSAHLRAGRCNDAIALFDQSLELNPNFGIVLVWKAMLCSHDGRAEEARDAMARAREAEPQIPFWLWELRMRRLNSRTPALEELLKHLRMAWAATESAA